MSATEIAEDAVDGAGAFDERAVHSLYLAAVGMLTGEPFRFAAVVPAARGNEVGESFVRGWSGNG